MSGITPPSYPGDERQSQQEYDWVNQMLGLGRDYSRVNHQGPFGSTQWDGDTLRQTYDPQVEGDFRGILGTRAQQREMLSRALAGFNPTSLPAAVDQVAPSPQMLGYDRSGFTDATPGGLMQGFDRSGFANTTPGEVASGYDRSGFQGIPGLNDFGGERQRVEDALFNRSAARLDRRFGQGRSDLETSLRNKGFVSGSEGFDRAMTDFGEQENDAYSSAMNDAIAAGGQEQSRMFADALRARGQQNQEGMTDVGLWNNAQGTQFGQAMQQRGMQNAEGRDDFDMWNAAQGQDFGQRFGLRGLEGQEAQQDWSNYNTSMGRNFDERLASGQFQNAIRGQRYGEERDKFTLPFQLAASMDQNPLLPQMHPGTVGLAQPRAPSFSDFTQLGYQSDLNRSNWNTSLLNQVPGLIQGAGSMIPGGWGAVPGMIGGMFSGGSQGQWGGGANPDWGMNDRGGGWTDPGMSTEPYYPQGDEGAGWGVPWDETGFGFGEMPIEDFWGSPW